MAANGTNATTPRPTVSGYNGLSVAIGKAISNVLQGQGTAADALKEAQTKADQALASSK
jgi:multiple sugar transport system substrate-binding protein